MMTTIDQRFSSFHSVMLHTMKDLVINMASQLSNQQRSNPLSPPPNDILHTPPPIYLYHEVFLQHPYTPQTTSHSPLTNMSPPSSYLHPPVHILPQYSQGTTPSSHQMLPPPPQPYHISTNSSTQQS